MAAADASGLIAGSLGGVNPGLVGTGGNTSLAPSDPNAAAAAANPFNFATGFGGPDDYASMFSQSGGMDSFFNGLDFGGSGANGGSGLDGSQLGGGGAGGGVNGMDSAGLYGGLNDGLWDSNSFNMLFNGSDTLTGTGTGNGL